MKNPPKQGSISSKKDSRFVKTLKQKIYTWHRTIGIITLIPVIFWTLSGLTHPFMAHFFKPTIPNERLSATTIDQSKLKFSLYEVFQKNKLTKFKNFRVVHFNNTSFYQVKTELDSLLYFNTLTGEKLQHGDQRYAHWLSRYFLNDQKSAISKTEKISQFNSQYKYINRYLPVYKTSFDRPDGIEVYVETSSSTLATFNPKVRQVFIWFFDTFHNWSFLDAVTNNHIRILLMICILTIIILSALSGIIIYGLFWKQFKKSDQSNHKKGIRQYHRQIGLSVSLVTITFALSGGYHATTKWQPYLLDKMVYEPLIDIKDVPSKVSKLPVDWSRFDNFNLVAYDNKIYYRCLLSPKKNKYQDSNFQSQSSHKRQQKAAVIYIDAATNKTVPNLDLPYATFLVKYFASGNSTADCCEMNSDPDQCQTSLEEAKVLESKVINNFESREYGFVNKRLPVVKLVFDTEDKTTYFIEVATSRLAAVITKTDKIEGYSFAIFHKFLLLDWAGKTIRDLSMIIVALGVLVVSVLGLCAFLKK